MCKQGSRACPHNNLESTVMVALVTVPMVTSIMGNIICM